MGLENSSRILELTQHAHTSHLNAQQKHNVHVQQTATDRLVGWLGFNGTFNTE